MIDVEPVPACPLFRSAVSPKDSRRVSYIARGDTRSRTWVSNFVQRRALHLVFRSHACTFASPDPQKGPSGVDFWHFVMSRNGRYRNHMVVPSFHVRSARSGGMRLSGCHWCAAHPLWYRSTTRRAY
jgi:hypothetical protein